MRELTPPFVIDEIQYAPRLLSPIKQLVDRGGLEPGAVRLTGSQSFQVMEGVTETLAGRVAILNLLGLSDEEKALPRVLPPDDYFRRILETGFPRLHGTKDRAARDLYLSSYVQTYIERDIRELLRIEKRREFETFVKLCALRTGQIVSYDDLARDAGVAAATAKKLAQPAGRRLPHSLAVAVLHQPDAANDQEPQTVLPGCRSGRLARRLA